MVHLRTLFGASCQTLRERTSIDALIRCINAYIYYLHALSNYASDRRYWDKSLAFGRSVCQYYVSVWLRVFETLIDEIFIMLRLLFILPSE